MGKRLEPAVKELIEDFYSEGCKTYEIRDFFADNFDNFRINIPYGTIRSNNPQNRQKWNAYKKEVYRKDPDARAKRLDNNKEYSGRPDVKIAKKKYLSEYYKKNKQKNAENHARYELTKNLPDLILRVFDSGILTAADIRMRIAEKSGIHFPRPLFLEDKIDCAIREIAREVGELNAPIIPVEDKYHTYMLNRSSPYWRVCDGFEHDEGAEG